MNPGSWEDESGWGVVDGVVWLDRICGLADEAATEAAAVRLAGLDAIVDPRIGEAGVPESLTESLPDGDVLVAAGCSAEWSVSAR